MICHFIFYPLSNILSTTSSYCTLSFPVITNSQIFSTSSANCGFSCQPD